MCQGQSCQGSWAAFPTAAITSGEALGTVSFLKALQTLPSDEGQKDAPPTRTQGFRRPSSLTPAAPLELDQEKLQERPQVMLSGG